MHPNHIARTCIRDTLITFPEVTNLVQLTPGVYKIFWEHVEPTLELPYISLHHFSGGLEKDTNYYEAVWRIVGHTGSIEVGDALEGAIHKLSNQYPVTDSFPEICAWDSVKEMLPMFTRYAVRNVPLFAIGGLYRVRLNLGSL